LKLNQPFKRNVLRVAYFVCAQRVYTDIKGGVFLAKSISRYVDTPILPLINKRCLASVGFSPFFSYPYGIRKFSTSSLRQQNGSKLVSLLDSFPSLSENLHLYITSQRQPNIKKCHQILLKMYNSLSDPVVKLFIQNNCSHLISLDKFDKEIIQRDFIDYRVDGPDKQGHPSLYTGKSGCYAFLCLKTGDYYVGSAICLYTRYKTHKVRCSRPEKGGSTSLYLSIRKHGWQNFAWRPLILTNNYINNFTKQNPEYELSLESLFILRSITQFEVRLYEQFWLTQFRPGLNSNYVVGFPFSNGGDISTYHMYDSSKPIEVRVGDNTQFLMKFSSKNRAAVSLGIPKTTLERYINLTNFTIYSPVLEMDVYLIDPSKPLSEDSPSYTTTDGVMTITDVDLYALAKGKLFALLLDKKSIFGVYENPSQAAKILDGKSDSRYISRYINLERPVAVGQDKTPVYFVMNPSWKSDIIGRIAARPSERKISSLSRSIVLVDVLNQSALVFNKVSDMSRYLGRKALTDTGYVKKYMNPTKLYKGRYEFHYQNEYTGTITGKGPSSS
jgi:hypothetical protein